MSTLKMSMHLKRLPDTFDQERRRRGLSWRAVAEEVGTPYADLHRFAHRKVDCRSSTVMRVLEWLEK